MKLNLYLLRFSTDSFCDKISLHLEQLSLLIRKKFEFQYYKDKYTDNDKLSRTQISNRGCKYQNVFVQFMKLNKKRFINTFNKTKRRQKKYSNHCSETRHLGNPVFTLENRKIAFTTRGGATYQRVGWTSEWSEHETGVWGLAPEKFLRPRPLERWKTPFCKRESKKVTFGIFLKIFSHAYG